MMKRLYSILLLLIFAITLQAQDNVFILVDVSLSVKQNELDNAKQALNEILTGAQPSKAFIYKGQQQDLVNFKLKQGDKLAVSRFGSLNTTLAISPNPITIQNINADANQALESVAWTPVDGQTYLTLAKAKIAEYAKNHGISKYKLYIITDNVNDDYGPNGKPDYSDEYTQNLAEDYNSSTNPVSEAGYTKLKFAKNSLFMLSLSPSVDISNYKLPPGGALPPIVDDNPNPTISLSTPKGKKGKEYELKTETLNLNWTCTHCPEGIRYTVSIAEYDGGKFKETKKDLTANTFSMKLPDGKFRVTVSASNCPASSDTTFISVSTGSYGWLLFVLILLVGGGVGYYFWNKKRQQKIEGTTSAKADSIFTKQTGTTNNSSNSDYF